MAVALLTRLVFRQASFIRARTGARVEEDGAGSSATGAVDCKIMLGTMGDAP